MKHIVGKEGMHGLVTANYKYQILKKRKKKIKTDIRYIIWQSHT